MRRMTGIENLKKRVENLEPEPETGDPEGYARLMQAFKGHFLDRLNALGCAQVMDEVKTLLATTHPTRPFGYDRRDDHPYWNALEPIFYAHHNLAHLIKAAESFAWSDVYSDLGETEDSYRAIAERELEMDKKEKQTFCDICGQALGDWWCYSGKGKICRSCSGC
jgi:hypothetical protein